MFLFINTMFDASIYGPTFLNFILAVTLMSSLLYVNAAGSNMSVRNYNFMMLGLVAGFIILFLGTRPISAAYFVDMGTYADIYQSANITGNAPALDWLFSTLVQVTSKLISVESFFLLCVALYIIPLVVATLRVHSYWAFVVFLALMGGFQCYPYIVNGMRNGIATSMILLAFSYRDKKWAMLILMFLAAGFHKSVLLPAVVFLVTGLIPNVTLCSTIWFMCFTVSRLGGAGLTESLGALISFGDDERVASYTMVQGYGGMGKAGFRLDFIAFSILPIVIGYSLASAEAKRDTFYRRLICTYLVSNAVWLLLIYSEFSNRFAYLSWFMLPWVIVYPYLPIRNAPNSKPSIYLAPALFVHFIVTYFLYRFYS